MRYISREGTAGWPGRREFEIGPLQPGDGAEVLIFGSGLAVVAALSLVALLRLLALGIGAG